MAYNQIYQPITIDPMGAYQAGQEMRQQRQQADRANALADYEAENTDQLMSGDRNAWAGYARAGGGIGNALAGMKATQPAPINPEEQFKRMKIVADVLGKVQTPEDFQAGEDWLVRNRIITPQDAEGYSFADLPRLQAMAQEALKPTADIQNYEYGQRNPGFNDWRKTEAKPAGPSSDIAKLRADLKAGYITQEDFEARANKMLAPSGQRISFDENGNPVIETGGAVGGGLGRRAQGEIEQLQIDASKSLGRLQRIEQKIAEVPDILDSQTLMGQLKRMGLEWQDFVDPSSLSPEQQEFLVNVTQLRSDLLDNLSYTIKEITGAAMTEAEAKRINATMPNANDSPTMFMAKLENALNRTRASIARYNMWRTQGLDGSPESLGTLSEIEGKMKTRRSELWKQVDAGEMDAETAAQVFFKEFGI